MNNKQHVFISYAHEDRKQMQWIHAALTSAGFPIWTDEGLSPGVASWRDAIQDAIEHAHCIVALLSPSAKKSRWVKNELDYADAQGIRVFPVLISGDDRTSIPLSLISSHYTDLRGSSRKRIALVVAAINELMSDKADRTLADLPMQPSQPKVSPSSEDQIRILIVDDIDVTRQALRGLLSYEPDLVVVGEANTGREGVRLVKELNPNIVLMDINMPDMDGITATSLITQSTSSAAVIIISIQNDQDYLRRSLLAGAKNFLAKPVQTEILYETIRGVHKQHQKWLGLG